MNILKTFGIGRRKIILQNNRTFGVVTSVKPFYLIKINKKTIRTHALDGAVFPNIIYFSYHVNGSEYKGSSYISYNLPCPKINEKITVFFDENNPSDYAVKW